MNPMGELDPIRQVMFLRSTILPPYAEDDDEERRNASDYRAFYAETGVQCLSNTEAYINALRQFWDNPDSAKAFEGLLEARAQFIRSFPFSHDELGQGDADYAQAVDFMRSSYRDFVRKGTVRMLLDDLEEYRKACQSLHTEV